MSAATTRQLITEASGGQPQNAAGVAFAAGEQLAQEKLRQQEILAPIAGPGVKLPLIVNKDGSVAIITGLHSSPLAAPFVALQAPSSLIAYVKRFGTDSTALFVEDAPQPRVTAIVDFHKAADDAPPAYAWCRHRAIYEPLLTPEWNTWVAASGKRIGQVEFAQFLEANLPDIADPAGATILEIARTLEVKKAVNFQSSVRLDNGEVQLRYEEDIQGTAQKGLVTIPQTITLGLEPFKGAGRYQINAFLRYRLEQGGAVKLGIDLDRPHKVLEAAANEVLDRIVTELDAVPVFHGPAPKVPEATALTLR